MERFEQLSEEIFVCTSGEHGFGTDAFLLAHFARPKHKDKVCDLGTGCGIIPLAMEKNFAPREILGVDIQENAIAQFQKGIEKSGKRGKITALLGDLKEVKTLLKPQGQSFDKVTCNPPYKLAGTGLLNANESHSIARHELFCTIQDVCAAANFLLRFGGKFSLCQRPQRLFDTMAAMETAGIAPKRLRFVSKNESTAPWLFLLEGVKGGQGGLTVEPHLFMYTPEGQLRPEIRGIYGHAPQKEYEV